MGKRFWLILLVVVAVLVGVFVLTNHHSQTAQPVAATPGPNTITASDHVRGNSNAKVTLLEYGDFQCPACGNAYPMVKQLEQTYPNQLRVVFRHFPLTNVHPNAFSGARAAEAAADQGKFFEMHDLLYQNQNQWGDSSNAVDFFRNYARQLGLDINKFNSDYGASATSARINADVQSGKNAKIDATPAFYINGQKISPNPQNFDEFSAKIQAAVAANP